MKTIRFFLKLKKIELIKEKRSFQFQQALEQTTTMGSTTSRVYATGNWRKHPEWVAKLGTMLGSGWEVTLLSQEDEAEGQSRCAHKLMDKAGLLSDLDDDRLVLFMGAGRGSSQFTLLNLKGERVTLKMGTGYSKDGPPPVGELKNKLVELSREYGNSIGLVVAFDSFYHICKGSCPVVKDKDFLPESVMTTCGDFADALEILPESWKDILMVVVRNFQVMGLDGICKIGHLTTFEAGDGVFDLGSGRVAVTDPLNGTFRYETDLPDGWTDDESKLKEITDLLRAGQKFVRCDNEC